MKIVILLCLFVGVFCFAAKDALDYRTTQLTKYQQLTLKTSIDDAARSTQVIKNA